MLFNNEIIAVCDWINYRSIYHWIIVCDWMAYKGSMDTQTECCRIEWKSIFTQHRLRLLLLLLTCNRVWSWMPRIASPYAYSNITYLMKELICCSIFHMTMIYLVINSFWNTFPAEARLLFLRIYFIRLSFSFHFMIGMRFFLFPISVHLFFFFPFVLTSPIDSCLTCPMSLRCCCITLHRHEGPCHLRSKCLAKTSRTKTRTCASNVSQPYWASKITWCIGRAVAWASDRIVISSSTPITPTKHSIFPNRAKTRRNRFISITISDRTTINTMWWVTTVEMSSQWPTALMTVTKWWAPMIIPTNHCRRAMNTTTVWMRTISFRCWICRVARKRSKHRRRLVWRARAAANWISTTNWTMDERTMILIG